VQVVTLVPAASQIEVEAIPKYPSGQRIKDGEFKTGSKVIGTDVAVPEILVILFNVVPVRS